MAGIELVMVFAVATLNLAIVARSICTNHFCCIFGLLVSFHISRNISFGLEETSFLVLYFSCGVGLPFDEILLW